MKLSLSKTNRCTRLQIESLEPRAMLDGDDLLLANDAYLTLSFADDGVEVAGQTSALHAKFNTIAPEAVWKHEILRAFQTWTINTSADVGVRNDGGQPFGSPGATFGDPRFGDIRIGAIAMDPNIGAVSVPVDGVVGGTWMGDVLFNTEFNFSSLGDIFAIALHEAGNVLGLDDNSEPGSPLNIGEFPNAVAPTPNDIANLHALYGIRPEDQYESLENGDKPNNNSFVDATAIAIYDTVADIEGPIPSLVYGDIGAAGDVDFFRLQSPDNYTGFITLTVRTSGISLLTPRLQVYDNTQQLISDVTSTSAIGDELSTTIYTSRANSDYYIKIETAATAAFNIGGYSLTVVFDDLNEMPLDVLRAYADGSLRKLTSDQLAEVLEPDDDLYEVDGNTNDNLASAEAIAIDADFAVGARYELNGSISDAIDRDYYSFKSPASFAAATGFLTVSVRSTTLGGLVPNIAVTDTDGLALPSETLLNGGGDVILQVSDVQPGDDVVVAVTGGDARGLFATGNYQLTASFQEAAIQLDSFATGTLAPTEFGKAHTFYVGQPQLFQFRLNASGGVPLSAVLATIRNDSGQVIRRLAAPVGEVRTQEALLLGSGEYSVEFSVVSLYGAVTTAIDYELAGIALSDPFAGDPDDPNNHPFACQDPELAGFFCYPGEFVSNDPYLWDDFVDSLADPLPPLSTRDIVDLLLGDWWSWVWDQAGVNGPPLALNDRFDIQRADGSQLVGLLTTSPNVLTNDIDPEGGQFVAVLTGGTTHGTVELAPDGTVSYTPDPGFFGTDSFTYLAYDFLQDSTPATAYLVVGSGLTGDYDGSGTVDAGDYAVWKATRGSTTEFQADGNHDERVSLADYTIYRDNLGASIVPPAVTAFATLDQALSIPTSSAMLSSQPDASVAASFLAGEVQATQPAGSSSTQQLQRAAELPAAIHSVASQHLLLLHSVKAAASDRKSSHNVTMNKTDVVKDEVFAHWPNGVGQPLAATLGRPRVGL